MDLKKYQAKLRKFADERDWHKFHTRENLVKSICIEAGELLECFQWEPNPHTAHDITDIGLEIADIQIYLLMLADNLKLDIEACVRVKMRENARKYPINKSKGNAIKYDKR